MKYTILLPAIIALAIAIVACKRASTEAVPQGAGVVVFPDAGVSIEVGEGWTRLAISPGPPICLPTLVCKAGLIGVLLLPPAIPNQQAAADSMRSMFNSDTNSVKDTFRQEAFTTDSGLNGQHISYAYRTQKHGRVTEEQNHYFFLQRQDGRCVAVNYMDTANTNSEPVVQMIQKSLKLQ